MVTETLNLQSTKGNAMDAISLIQQDVVFARFLLSLDERHPSPHGCVLIYGANADTENYVRIAKGLGFKVHISGSSGAFADEIQSNPHVKLIVIISDRIEQGIRDELIRACETFNPLYALHVFSQCGTVPGTDQRYRLTIHDHDLFSGHPLGDRVARATRDLFSQANIEDLTDKSVPRWIEQELAHRDKS